MRDHNGHISEKVPIPVFPDKLQGFFLDHIWSIGHCMRPVVPIQVIFLRVFPEVSRVVAMCIALTVVSEEIIKALFHRIPFRSRKSQSPLPECTGHITCIFKKFGHGLYRCGQGCLTFGFNFPVSPDGGMPRMQSGHQHRAGRSTYRTARIMSGKPDPFTGRLIQVRSGKLLLSVTG